MNITDNYNTKTVARELGISRSGLHQHVTRAETILSTPGVTGLDWEPYRDGEDPIEHLAYLQGIAQREHFSLRLPPAVKLHLRRARKHSATN